MPSFTICSLPRVRNSVSPKTSNLSFMALPVIPELKLTARGLFNVNTFSFVGVEAD